MVAHRQEKRRPDAISCCENGHAVLFLPIGIFDEERVEPARKQMLELRDDALAFVADHEVDCFDPRADQSIQSVRNQGAAKHWDKRLQESFVRATKARLPACLLAKAFGVALAKTGPLA